MSDERQAARNPGGAYSSRPQAVAADDDLAHYEASFHQWAGSLSDLLAGARVALDGPGVRSAAVQLGTTAGTMMTFESLEAFEAELASLDVDAVATLRIDIEVGGRTHAVVLARHTRPAVIVKAKSPDNAQAFGLVPNDLTVSPAARCRRGGRRGRTGVCARLSYTAQRVGRWQSLSTCRAYSPFRDTIPAVATASFAHGSRHGPVRDNTRDSGKAS